MSTKVFCLNYRYPQNVEASAYPSDASDICKAVANGLFLHRITSVFLVLGVLTLVGFFVSSNAGVVASTVFVIAASLKIIVLATMGVRLDYKMDKNWRNYANTRMAAFTYMSHSQCILEVTKSCSGCDRKYNAGCGTEVDCKPVRVAYSVPFPFKPIVNAYTLYLPDAKFVFLPDCVYMVKGCSCVALHYEHIKWSCSMTTFIESRAPLDSRVVGKTWQYVNKNGGPDRRFSYNPELVKCSYGEMKINFANRRHVTIMLSGTRVSECIMRLPPCK